MKKKHKLCGYKVRYADKDEAELALSQLATDFVYSNRKQVMFNAMNSYKCKIHDCYHLGDKRRKNKKLKLKGSSKRTLLYAFS